MHRIAVVGVLALGLILGGWSTASAQAAAPKAQIVTKGQRTLEQRATLRVALRAGAPGLHRVRLTLRTLPGGKARAAGVRTVTLRARGQRIVAVRLTPAARRLLGRCRPLRATVTLSRAGRRAARGSSVLSVPRRGCAPGPASGVPGAPAPAGPADAGSPSGGPAGPGGSGGTDPAAPAPVAPGFDTATAERCDPTDPSVCLHPFPNDHFTDADPDTATGRRLALASESTPRNVLQKPIDPADINVSDGFSPGSSLITKVPGLDSPAALTATKAPPIDDPGASLLPGSPVVVVNTRTGEPHPVWAEVDANAADPADRALIIRPAVNFEEGARYVVALRRMRTATGAVIPAGRAFSVYRDRIVTTSPAVERRRPALEAVFAELARAGVAREELFLAWDFTVATAKSATGRMLSIRDRAFAGLGDTNLADRQVAGAAPQFQLNPDLPDDSPLPELPSLPGLPGLPGFDELDGVRELTPEEDPQIARVVRGTFTVPCFLTTPACVNGGRFAYAGDAFTPTQVPGNVSVGQFTCLIPRRGLEGVDPAKLRPNLYGHGLFGGQGEVFQGQQKALAQEHGFLPCATDWKGMATQDVPTALLVLQDLSLFPLLIDHVQQGFLQKLFLGRLMIHPDGFAKNAAFQRADGTPVIDTSRLFYDGNSQGGIYGGSLTAIAPDFERAVLGVPGMNYSTLLPRSVDFDMYANGSFGGVDAPLGGLYDNYPDELERPLVLALIQIMWDRGDPNGYAAHMTSDPLPNTPSHEVLMHVGYGDHQVADVSAEVMARTAGARVHRPVLEPGRPRYGFPEGQAASPSATPVPLMDSLGGAGYSATGSGLVFWDIGPVRGEEGTAPPPAANLPPRVGRDPHEAPRRTVNGRAQKSAFLRDDGRIVDVCGGPCFAFDYGGGAPQP